MSAHAGRTRLAPSIAVSLGSLVLLAPALPAAAAPARTDAQVALFVGGSFGDARTLALDAAGRTVAQGIGRGRVSLLSPCPGGERLAEIAFIRSDARMRAIYELAIRETPSLRIVRRQSLKLPGWRFAVGLLCEDRAASSTVIFAAWAGDSALRAAIYRVAGRRLGTVWRGTAFLSSLRPGIAYLNAGFGASRLISVDLHTGRIRRIVWLPRSPTLVPDDTGTRLAGVAYQPDERSRLILVDLSARPPATRSVPLAAPDVVGDVHWLSAGRMLFVPADGGEAARVLDLTLRTRSRFRWNAGQSAVVGSTLFGIRSDRRTLVTAPLPSGPMHVVRRLPGTPAAIVASAG